jgi:aspartate kinase
MLVNKQFLRQKFVENDLATHVTVMKFGGTSLEDGPAFRRVANIVGRSLGSVPIVIASAMSGMTNALLTSLRTAAGGEINGARRSLEEHFERHLKVTRGLGETAKTRTRTLVEHARHEITEMLNLAAVDGTTTSRLDDAMASHGERLSANLLTIVLESHGLPAVHVDARRCIVTNEEHGNARPLIRETWRRSRTQLKPMIANGRIPVLEGFVGATKNGLPSTLGRGSSNYTATLVGAALDAREVQIWTDVNGVLTADPCLVTKPRTILTLSYAEASELARLGTQVLHARMIQPARDRDIPVRICNSRAPKGKGTLICRARDASPGVIKAIAYQANLTRVDITSTPAFVANGFLGAIRQIFNYYQTQMDMVTRSETMISLTCHDAVALSSIAQNLEQLGSVEIKTNCAIVSCVGEGLQYPRRGREVLKRLKEIDPMLAWHRTSSVNLTTMVDRDSLASVVRRLHSALFQ